MNNFELDKICQAAPPSFGHPILKYFGFDPKYVNLNNGSYGSVPLPVHAECNKITLDVERNPEFHHRFTHYDLQAQVRQHLAPLIGAQADECVIVPNATHGINTVLRNIEWENGDIIIDFNTTYGAVSRTAQYLSDRPPHPSISTLTVNFPGTTHADIISKFRAHVKSVVDSKPPGKRVVALIDAIVANPGVHLPWQELVKICKDADVLSVVDAAHAIGQELNINLGKAQPDFWVSNCHKWLFSKRGCAVLYVPKRNQHLIKSSIPTSHSYVSPGNAPTFIQQFDWNGTTDFVPFYSVLPALRFREWLGGEDKINSYCHDLAVAGGKRLAEVLGTQVLDPDGSLTLNMVNVELPLSGEIKWTPVIKNRFSEKLLKEHNVFAASFYHSGRWWARCSAQIYNELSDFEVLGRAFLRICPEIQQEFGVDNAANV
ncbi:Pyridoxal phosphate-dependent transferase [Pleurotus pulmonarius]